MQTRSTASHDWAATNMMTTMATRLVGSEAYLGREERTLGTLVAANLHELFTVCSPGEALELHFEQQQPTFIAVHDIGQGGSAAFLSELGAALRQPIQMLTIRQQGSGVTLALLRFIELPSPRGTPVRVYSTAVEGDTSARQLVANALMAFSRLGVLLVDAMPDHLLASRMSGLRDRLLTVPWKNRELLLVPRGDVPRLTEHGQRLSEGTVVNVRSAAPATQTGPIWRAVHAAWSSLRSGASDTPMPAPRPRAMPVSTDPVKVPAAPAPSTPIGEVGGAPITLRQMPVPANAPQPAAPTGAAAYAQACATLRGAMACVVFDQATRRVVALAGTGADPSAWIAGAAASLSAAQVLAETLGGGDAAVESVATLDRHVILCRTVARAPGLGIVIGFDKAQSNLALHRAQLQRLDAMLR